MIRRSVVSKMTVLITGLVLLVLAMLYISLSQLFRNAVFHNVLSESSGHSLSALMNIAQWLFVLAAFGAVLIASGLAIILSNQLARPLVQMARATQRMTGGNYDARVAVTGEDEVARLGKSINELASNLDFIESSRHQFLADISHELRTPLSYIHGYAQVLSEGLVQSQQEQSNYLKIIYEESQRLERLITNLFNLAQAEEGVLKIDPVPTDMKQLIQTVVRHVRPFADQKHTRIVTTVDIEHKIVIDPIRLEQVLFNLVDNATRYMSSNGLVRITAVEANGLLEVQVSDNGPGIPETDLPHIWDRLYRVEKSRSRKSGGTGLGLAIVKQIVELHGGTVQVQSQLDEGTSMRIRIPISTASSK